MASIDFKKIDLRNNRHPERKYPWKGGDPEEDDTLSELMNYTKTGIGATSAVGCFSQGASPYGCRDISGNVWEWCRNRYSEGDSHRVLRGGAWSFTAEHCRTAFRFRHDPAYRFVNFGFRLVCLPGQPGEPSQ